MKKTIAFFYLISLLILHSVHLSAQENQIIDSLNKLLETVSEDTSKINLLILLSEEHWYSNPQEAENYANQALKLAQRNNDNQKKVLCLNTLGSVQEQLGEYTKALKTYENALQLEEKLDNKLGIAACYINLGRVYESQSENNRALECFEKALEIQKDLKNVNGIASSLNFLGIHSENIGDYEQAIKYFKESLELAKTINNKQSTAVALNNIGLIHDRQGKHIEALEYYQKALEINIELDKKSNISDCLNNIGITYDLIGNSAKAIEYYERSLAIDRELNDKPGISICLNNIGMIHYNQGNYEQALMYYNQSLQIDEELGDLYGVSICLVNIGEIYLYQKNYTEALNYFNRSNQISQEIGNQSGIGWSTRYIGTVYLNQGKYDDAIKFFEKSLAINSDLGAQDEISEDYIRIGESYYHLNKYKTAEKYCIEGLKIAQKIEAKKYIKMSANLLAKIYAKQDNYRKAYEYHILYKNTYDSIFTEESNNKLNLLESRFEIERKEQEIEEQNTKIEKQQIKQNALLGGLIAILFIVILVIVGNVRIRKAKNIIASQKEQIEESNEELIQSNEELRTTMEINLKQKEEITDSIQYAKYIQNAILPQQEKRDSLLNKHFVYFRPRNIVSGDFYWITKVEERTIIAAADCTGHGVPGAFMSMLGVSFLNDIVNKEYITHTGVILRRLRKEVINALQQKGKFGEQRDGMDIALCSINYDNLNLQFSGANNPLYIIRSSDKEPIDAPFFELDNHILYEINGDRMPIAFSENMNRYKTTEIQLIKGDSLYMFSDGYIDQFGGEKGKKFMKKRFKELLLANVKKPMRDQENIIQKTLEDWKQNYEQVDDIMVIGVKI